MEKFILTPGDKFYYHGDIYLLTDILYKDDSLDRPAYCTQHLEFVNNHEDNGTLAAITIDFPHKKSEDFYLIERADFVPPKFINKFSLC